MIHILEFLDKTNTKAEWALALLFASSALRDGEGMALRWSDVDSVRGVIRVKRAWSRGEQTKGKAKESMVDVAMDARESS
jgi:integrase